MKRLLKYLKDYKKECVIAPAFKMLEALFELFVPLVMTKIIDLGITGHDKTVVYKNGAILVLLGLIGLTCSLTAQFFAARAAIGFSKGVRKDLYSKILSFSYENTDKLGTSSLITRMTNDINTSQNGVNMVLRLLLRSPFIVFGAMIMAFTINVKAAVIFTLVIPVLFAVVAFITFKTIPMYKNIQKKLDRLTLHIRENLAGARVIRSFRADDDEEAEFDDDNQSFYRMNTVTARISAILNPATLILVNLALMVVLYNGGNLVNDGILTNGQVVALINYMSQILIELVKLTNLFVTINKALASTSRIADTLDVKETLEDNGTLVASDHSKNDIVLSFEDVSFRYPGAGAESLYDISFSVNKGETIGIIGGTGSGKSTLSHLIMRFYDADSGKISLFGNPIKDYTLHSVRDVISLVPQKAQLFSGSVRSNLILGCPDASDETLWEALRISEGKEIIEKKGEGLDHILTEAGSNLSGGQKQRLTIARALVKDNPVLILDDSSSALDYATDARLRANLKKLSDKLTVFIISQRVVSVKDADKILVLDDGHMAGFDTHENLLKTSTVYREIVNSQSGKEAM
ncbi:MAG: ABC transporter ATP-binding protein [Lachnospiraceae bacterium]|nr:ABC transporter ATP-binding protein [Lachnospiraceae bacterium]